MSFFEQLPPRLLVRGSFYTCFFEWDQFRTLTVAQQLHIVVTLETKCFTAAANPLDYGCLATKFIVAYGESVRRVDANAIEYLLAKYLQIDARVADSELTQSYHQRMLEHIERRRNSRAAKVYSNKHFCYNCKGPMEILGGRITKCGDESTSILLHCSKCDIRKTI